MSRKRGHPTLPLVDRPTHGEGCGSWAARSEVAIEISSGRSASTAGTGNRTGNRDIQRFPLRGPRVVSATTPSTAATAGAPKLGRRRTRTRLVHFTAPLARPRPPQPARPHRPGPAFGCPVNRSDFCP